MARSARLEDAGSQRQALEKIAVLIRKGQIHPEILKAAKIITRGCDARNDLCELQALYDAVKNGDSRVPWLTKGVRYVADSRSFDNFHAVSSLIEFCLSGACAFDCDDHCILMGSLAAALGFMVGARAWGPGPRQGDDYVHVYAVAAIPKSGPWPEGYIGHALDTTVPRFSVGDEPEDGHVMTAWID